MSYSCASYLGRVTINYTVLSCVFDCPPVVLAISCPIFWSGGKIHDELVLECPACEEDLERLKVRNTAQAVLGFTWRLIGVCPFRSFCLLSWTHTIKNKSAIVVLISELKSLGYATWFTPAAFVIVFTSPSPLFVGDVDCKRSWRAFHDSRVTVSSSVYDPRWSALFSKVLWVLRVTYIALTHPISVQPTSCRFIPLWSSSLDSSQIVSSRQHFPVCWVIEMFLSFKWLFGQHVFNARALEVLG